MFLERTVGSVVSKGAGNSQSASTESEDEAVAKVVVKCVDHVLYLLLLLGGCFWNGWLYPLLVLAETK